MHQQQQQQNPQATRSFGVCCRFPDAELRKCIKQNGNDWEVNDLEKFEKFSNKIKDALGEKKVTEKEESERTFQENRKKLQERHQKLAGIRQLLQYQNLTELITDFVQVCVLFECGEKIERKFGVSDSLEILFNFVLAHEKCPNGFSLFFNNKELKCAPVWYKEYGTLPDRIETFNETGLDSSVAVTVKENQKKL
uniref:UBX domain-containing protein n=1 Tax=Panagrolaimus davidi TaxID=227884 RepID=A0A914QYS7_9BILA